MHPDDKFDGVFKELSPQNFSPITNMMFPTEITDFDEFVNARLEMTRLVFAGAPHNSISHAALSNGTVVCQFVPNKTESMADFLARLTAHARNMNADSFFFARVSESSSALEVEYSVLWIAHHLDGEEQILRSGLIPIDDNNNELGEILEAPMNPTFNVVAKAFSDVLPR